MQMNAVKILDNDEIDNHTLNDKEKEIERQFMMKNGGHIGRN
jgi:hypothetical protein